MATEIWVNTGSGNGLLPDGTKPLPEPMLTDHQWSPVKFIWAGGISQEIPQPLITKISMKITYLKFLSNLPRANELRACKSNYIHVELWYMITHPNHKFNSRLDKLLLKLGYEVRVQFEGILPKGPYLPWVSMAGRALLAGYHRNYIQ